MPGAIERTLLGSSFLLLDPAMLFQDLRARLGKFTVPIQGIFQYNASNWIREMHRSPSLHRRTYDSISGDKAEDRLRNARCFGMSASCL
jgi:hypothetical protein